MADKTKKSEGPSCACGKGDLYEEWLKNENKEKEDSDTITSNQAEDSNNSADSASKEDQKRAQANK